MSGKYQRVHLRMLFSKIPTLLPSRRTLGHLPHRGRREEVRRSTAVHVTFLRFRVEGSRTFSNRSSLALHSLWQNSSSIFTTATMSGHPEILWAQRSHDTEAAKVRI